MSHVSAVATATVTKAVPYRVVKVLTPSAASPAAAPACARRVRRPKADQRCSRVAADDSTSAPLLADGGGRRVDTTPARRPPAATRGEVKRAAQTPGGPPSGGDSTGPFMRLRLRHFFIAPAPPGDKGIGLSPVEIRMQKG